MKFRLLERIPVVSHVPDRIATIIVGCRDWIIWCHVDLLWGASETPLVHRKMASPANFEPLA